MNDEHIMIDGYNAIFRTPAFRDQASQDLEGARAELVRRIAEAFRGRRERVTVVFDGNREAVAGRAPQGGGVRVVFSRPPETADQRIQRLVEETQRAASGKSQLNLRIVSSDREVAGRARLWGAKAVSVEQFFRELEPQNRRGGERGRGDKSGRPGGSDRSGEGKASGRGSSPGSGSRREIEAWEHLFRRQRLDPDADDEE
jgi:predicted RNA-binding protein with PIN domain